MKTSLLCTTGLLLFGCAHHPAPTDQVAKSLSAVRGAQEVGAENVPEAALHLKLAEEQIAEAQRLMADGENERAEGRAQRADQDAELAVLLVRQSASKQKLDAYAHTSGGASEPAPATPAQSGGGQ